MKCPRCQAENPPGMRFCGQCAAPLSAICPSCGSANPPGNKFCGQCAAPLDKSVPPRFSAPDAYTPKHLAEKILTSKSALEGERKQVTVLFADLKGSMELLADRDPEEARKLLDPVLERMMAGVHHYEGTVNQVMGDGIMALFGAPLAHEDHAVRACYAALRMQEAVKSFAEGLLSAQSVSVQIRVGLNSGDVVVRAIGSDLRMDYTAVGQTTHLAARMEQLAPPGAIYATAAVLRLAEGHVTARSIGPTPVKGLPSLVEIWDITGTVTARLHGEVASPALTPFVGRDEPLRQIVRALALAEHGEGQVVAVIGEAGVGKSRLFGEFVQRHVTAALTLLRSRSVSYGKSSPYLPIVDLLKRGFQIGEADTAPAVAARVRDGLAALDPALEPDTSALLAVLGVPSDDPRWEQLDLPQRRERVLEAFKRLLLRLALDRPVVLLVEDLHWIDEATQELLDSFIDAVPTARILLLVNYRPEYGHTWAGKSFYTQIRLDPLPADISDHLLNSLLGADAGLLDLRQTLVERTQGNPFFLEESVRHLAESGVLSGSPGAYRLERHGVRIDVPVTVQGVLAARIDRLPPEDKRLLQAAAVVGKDVPLRVLETVAETRGSDLRRALARLQAVELLREMRAFPESMYTFKHSLTHEVTYGTLLGERKRTLHGAALEAMERLNEGRLTEHADTLARHAIASERWGKAMDYLREASSAAFVQGGLSRALGHAEQALEISVRLSSSEDDVRRAIDARLDMYAPLLNMGALPRLFPLMQEAEQLAGRTRDAAREGRAALRLSGYYWVRADYATGLLHAQKAFEIGCAIDDPESRIGGRQVAAHCRLGLGDIRGAIEGYRSNADGPDSELATRRFGITAPPYIVSNGFLAWCLSLTGDFNAALLHGDRAVAAAETSATDLAGRRTDTARERIRHSRGFRTGAGRRPLGYGNC
jgi:class 3 adenylate cyclase